MIFQRRLSWRVLALLVTLGALSISVVLPVAAQADGFGVGSGHGLEVGINLPALEQVQADINAGLYDRRCTEAEHDPNKWHTLVNVEARCHYNHHHGDDPNYVNDIFGTPGGWFDQPGQSVSYPWQTFPAQDRFEGNAAYIGTGRMENEGKHEGYGWVVRRDQPCPPQSSGAGCITDFRLQYHAIMGPMGAVTRWHSYSLELRTCQDPDNPATCGIGRHGGWTDFGRLFVTEPGNLDCSHATNEIFIPLAVDSQYMPLDRVESRDEVRCHPTLRPDALPQPDSRFLAEWWALQRGRTRFQLRSYDPLSNVNPSDPTAWNIFCAANDTNCGFNQSTMSAWIGYIYFMPEFVDFCSQGCIRVDADLNGSSDYSGYTNRWGGINPNCTAAALDCVPIEHNNIFINNVFGPREGGYIHSPCTNCRPVNYDLSPDGQNWLTWFNEKYEGFVPPDDTPIVQPPQPDGPAVYFQVNDLNADQLNLNLQLFGVADVYGLQAECSVDPQVLQGTTITQGDGFNDTNSFIIDEAFQADGVWRVAASRLKPNPAISGDSLAFGFNYNVLTSGDGNLQCSALVVDEDGNNIDLQVLSGTVVIAPPPDNTEPEPVDIPPVLTGTINGLAAYQNRPDESNIVVKLLGINDTLVTEFVTTADGTFSFGDIAVGDYTVQISAPQHIPVVQPVTIVNENEMVQLEAQLRAGDVDDNGVVDLVDVTLVGANFGIDAIPEIANVDLNGDGVIDVRDLSLAGGNFDLVSPLLSP
jgi:hypothetical protein